MIPEDNRQGSSSTPPRRQRPRPSGGEAPRIVHPYLIATVPVASLYADTLKEAFFSATLIPLFFLLGVTAILVFGLRLVFRAKRRAALATSYFVAISFFYQDSYSYANEWCNDLGLPDPRHEFVLLAWGVAVLVGFACFRWVRFDDRKLTSVANVVSACLVAVLLARIGVGAWDTLSEASPSAVSDDEHEHDQIRLTRPANPPDIYYLVFDRYCDNYTLKKDFRFDNTPFYNSLRKRGFAVATDSHTNYPRTMISMASTLNMEYHKNSRIGYDIYIRQIYDHKVGRLLKSQGYKYHHLGNWYGPLRSNKNADINYPASALPSEFACVLYEMTPYSKLLPARDTCKESLDQFEAVERIASEQGPKFVYAHFLLPHTPFKFDKDGSSLPWASMVARSYAENYVNQLIFTNKRMLEMIDSILAKSTIAPIIVVQADEGDWLHEVSERQDRLANLQRRTGIISAFFLPGLDSARKIPPTITPVNSFRLIFKEYFNADIQLLDDRTFYWEHATPLGTPRGSPNFFVDVTEEVRRSGTPTRGQPPSNTPHRKATEQ